MLSAQLLHTSSHNLLSWLWLISQLYLVSRAVIIVFLMKCDYFDLPSYKGRHMHQCWIDQRLMTKGPTQALNLQMRTFGLRETDNHPGSHGFCLPSAHWYPELSLAITEPSLPQLFRAGRQTQHPALPHLYPLQPQASVASPLLLRCGSGPFCEGHFVWVQCPQVFCLRCWSRSEWKQSCH